MVIVAIWVFYIYRKLSVAKKTQVEVTEGWLANSQIWGVGSSPTNLTALFGVHVFPTILPMGKRQLNATSRVLAIIHRSHSLVFNLDDETWINTDVNWNIVGKKSMLIDSLFNSYRNITSCSELHITHEIF